MNFSGKIRDALGRSAPALMMLMTFGLAGSLHFSGGSTDRILGFAQGDTEVIAALELGRVTSVQVEIDAQVVPGQVVATLDTAAIDADIRLEQAELSRLQVMIPAEQVELGERIESDLAGLQRALAREREEQRRVRAEEDVLTDQISRVRQLVEDKQASLDQLSPLDLRRASVGALADEKPRTIELLRTQIAAAEERRKKLLEKTGPEAAQIEAELSVQRRKIQLLELKRSAHVLRAAHAGRVSAIRLRTGEVAAAGLPIVEMIRTRGRVVACVPERHAVDLRLGDGAKVWIRGQTGAALKGKAVTLGPLVAELPARCRPAPNVPVWGREVTIALDEPVDLVAGQAFDVVLDRSHRAAQALTTPPAAQALTTPSPPSSPSSALAQPSTPPRSGTAEAPAQALRMTVPTALRERTRLEPSGVLTRAADARYVLVSDDTGHKDSAGERAPWLFAMSATGVVDPEPLLVSGVSEIDDTESITAGEGNDVYLLSSQSFSAKGKRRRSRTALLKLQPEGRGFRAIAEVHLAELLDAAGPAVLAQLGLPDGTRPLDIEGMTYREGALYFGIKAPLDPQGRAMIWKLAAPRVLFDTKRLDGAGLSLWARARVDVELAGAGGANGGRSTPGGISELCFLPDGALAIASTPSTAEGAAGAVWRVARPEAGVLTPELLQRFPGLKPEGLSASLTPHKLLVVFDAGAETPSFAELPW